jgi:hypothetical protein
MSPHGKEPTEKMKAKRVILATAAVLTATLCIAGTSWHYKCETPNCRFEGNLGIGGGFVFSKVTGYCTTCREFVSIRWKSKGLTGNMKKLQEKATDLLDSPPKKAGTVWNPANGLYTDLYVCPKCKNLFMEIDSFSLRRSELSHSFCPSCTNLTLRFQHCGNYD